MPQRSISNVHPDLQKFAAKIPRMSYNKETLRRLRMLERLLMFRRAPRDVNIVNLFIAGPEPKQQIRLRVYRPKTKIAQTAAPLPALLWLHGGGYVIGMPEQDDVSCCLYARELGMVVISVEYRRAPENPFPSALEDSYTALKWAAEHAEALGIDRQRIAVGGASAGGGLAAGLVQQACDDQEVLPVFQLLVYPMLDDRTTLREDIPTEKQLTWNLEANRFGWESYLWTVCGDPMVPEYSVPARREDLSNQPPTWIGAGTLDLFHDEDVLYGQRLRASGVPCEVVVVPGAFHGFDLAGPRVPVVRGFYDSQIAALRRYLRLAV